jgi:hypothetical protein
MPRDERHSGASRGAGSRRGRRTESSPPASTTCRVRRLDHARGPVNAGPGFGKAEPRRPDS